jgi:hypothetical protein
VWVIGLDEAGLGPNLGPLVVVGTLWQLSDALPLDQLWAACATCVVSQRQQADPLRFAIGDSKQLYQPGKGLEPLARGVWATVGSALRQTSPEGAPAATFSDLWDRLVFPVPSPPLRNLSPNQSAPSAIGPLFQPWCTLAALDAASLGHGLAIPFANDAQRWQALQIERQFQLLTAAARVVEPAEFNRRLDAGQNKSELVSRVHWEVLSHLLTAARQRRNQPTETADRQTGLVVSDQHGGRRFYGSLLMELPDVDWVTPISETDVGSVYRSGSLEFRFEPRAERHLPVALASMTAKYLREVWMESFNEYWCGFVPGLKPTQGYPVDARRFWTDIADVRESQGFRAADLWRNK